MVLMAQGFADDGQRCTRRRLPTAQGPPQIVRPNIFEPGPVDNPFPPRLGRVQMSSPILFSSGEHPGIAFALALPSFQNFQPFLPHTNLYPLPPPLLVD